MYPWISSRFFCSSLSPKSHVQKEARLLCGIRTAIEPTILIYHWIPIISNSDNCDIRRISHCFKPHFQLLDLILFQWFFDFSLRPSLLNPWDDFHPSMYLLPCDNPRAVSYTWMNVSCTTSCAKSLSSSRMAHMPTSIELYSSIIRKSSVSKALPGTKVLPVTLFHPPFTYQDVKNRENSYSFSCSYKNFSKTAFRARRKRVWPKNQKSVPHPCYFAASVLCRCTDEVHRALRHL